MPRNDGTPNNTSATDKGPRLSSYLSGVGRKKATNTTAVSKAIDTTSVTSTSSHQPDLMAVFQKKVVETPPELTAASARMRKTTATTAITTTNAAAAAAAAATPARPKLDPWQWHDKLVSNEGKRSKLMEQRYQSKQIQYTAIQQLVSDAIQETSLAYRWTTSITKIQDEFAQSLTLKETLNLADMSSNNDASATNGTSSSHHMQYDFDTMDPEKLYNQMVETVTLNDTLPEKVKTIDNNNQDEETENSLAGSFNMDNAINEVAVIVTTTTTPTKRNAVLELISTSAKNITSAATQQQTSTPSPMMMMTNHHYSHNNNYNTNNNNIHETSGTSTAATLLSSSTKHQPPVFAISFPNPLCCNEAYYILHKQHELLQQTFSRNGVNQTSIDKIQQMKELAQENENKLHELAGTILQTWKVKEDEIQSKWNNYLSIAIEVLSSVPKTTLMQEWPKSTDGEQKMKYTTGDVWIAEILYRTAVKRQEINFVMEELTLQSLCEMVKDGERQRRTRLRHHMQMDVLQKHASIFERVQLSHADAIESYMSPTTTTMTTTTTTTTTATKQDDAVDGFVDEYKYLDNDTFHKDDNNHRKGGGKNDTGGIKKKKQQPPVVIKMEKKKLSIKEQIQDIATFVGTTTIWDPPNTAIHTHHDENVKESVTVDTSKQDNEDETKKNDTSSNGGGFNAGEVGAVDVDMYVGSFDDDNDEEDYDDYEDLPLLKDAIIDPYTIAGSPSSTSDKRKKIRGKRSKPAVLKTTDLIGVQKQDDTFKIHNAVVLDSESSKHAFFMDQLLFSGSLLESHYVQYAAVVGVDDNYSSYLDSGGESKSSKKDDAMSPTTLQKNGIIIVTSDDNLHLFEIPGSPTISSDNSYHTSGRTNGGVTRDEVMVVPGCNPDDALLALLKQSVHVDLILKEQQDMQALINVKSSPVPSSPSKLSSFLRAKSVTKEETRSKCFQFNNMTPSLSMALSECTVRQSLNGQSSVRISHNTINPRIASNKLIFASITDQHDFLKATRTDVTMWDLK